MPTSYTSLLGLAQPQTGELSGTWGDAVNLYITDYVDAAVAGVQTISGSQTAVTLSVTNGSTLVSAGSGATGSAQFQIINCTGNPASLLTITAPASSRQYIIINATSTSQSVKIVGSGPTTGITITSGEKAHVAWNGADFVKIATQNGTGEFVTVDTTNLEVTNIKAKDGTAAATIADSTGAITVSTILNVDNLRLDTNTLSSTDTNGNIVLAPNGNGDVQLDADTVRVGDSNVNVTITSNGTADLILNTNAGTNSGSITIQDGVDGNIVIAPNGNGQVQISNAALDLTTIEVTNIKAKDGTASATIADSTGVMTIASSVLTTTDINGGTIDGAVIGGSSAAAGTFTTITGTQVNSDNLRLDGNTLSSTDTNGNITIAPNGTGQVVMSGDLDLTTIEVTNIKAKDGTASIVLTDSTGALDMSKAVTMSATTQNIALGTSQTTGTFTVGGAAQTGTQTFDQSTKAHTLNIGAGATESAATKTINIGTGGVATSTTAIAIGSTSGSTTTLNGTVNLNAGTANGVAFLNASNVLTTGSALTFDGTNLSSTGGATFQGGPTGYGGGEVRLGTAASGQTSAISTLAVDSPVLFFDHRGSGNTGVFAWRNGTGSSNELMRLTSTGLGIGTSSPGAKLDVNGAARVSGATIAASGEGMELIYSPSTPWFTGNQALVQSYNRTGAAYTPLGLAGSQLFFVTGGANRATLDSSGNLGLGVTPSAWETTTYRASQIGTGIGSGSLVGRIDGANGVGLVLNGYYSNTGWKYIASSYATFYSQENGAHVWYNAPSGTAGNAISFTQAMTLSSDGTFRVKGAGTAGSTDAFQVAGTAPADAARITSGGKLLLNTASTIVSGNEIFSAIGTNGLGVRCTGGSASFVAGLWNDASSGDNLFVEFLTDTASLLRGSIDYNRAGGQVRYNTTSDYRAKEVYGTVQDSGAQIDALKIYRGKMLGATQDRPMMIAHEAQEVVPYAVGGEKDAINEDGTPKYQTMDHQILVPLLIAELQSLRARVAQLEQGA